MSTEHVGLGWRRHRVEVAAARLDAVLAAGIEAGRRPVSKLEALSDRLTDFHTKLEADADGLAVALDKVMAAAPAALARGHAFIERKRADIAAIDSAIRKLSNLPLDGSGESGG